MNWCHYANRVRGGFQLNFMKVAHMHLLGSYSSLLLFKVWSGKKNCFNLWDNDQSLFIQ